MPVICEKDINKTEIAEKRSRYLAHSDNVMMAVIDFHDGPQETPDPPHSHPHEQITFVAHGELYVFLGEEKTFVAAGDIFVVPPDLPHSVQPLTDHVRLVDTFTPIREDFLK